MDISIILCVHNPEERVFSRCLNAIHKFKTDNLDTEIILVDNNSSIALHQVEYIKEFFIKCPNAIYVPEAKPGLTYARIAGFKQAKAPIIIFFDDDNEPCEEYLSIVHRILSNKKEVGMIGPGTVNVDFIDGSNKWLESKRPIFQEIKMTKEKYDDNKTKYQECYPYGTGLVVRKEVMRNYSEMLNSRSLISDRNGDLLISGGDSQIVWCGIKMGFYAGRIPSLKLTHIIPGSRTTEAYLKRLHYSLGYSETKTLLGVFEEEKIRLSKKSSFTFYFVLLKCMVRNIFDRKKLLIEYIPNLIGKNSGYYFAFGEKKPQWLKLTEKAFQLNYYD